MSIRDRRDFWSGIMFTAVGLFFVFFARDYELGTPQRMGPGYFPTALGALLIVLGIAIALAGLARTPADGSDGRVGRFDFRALGLVLGAVVAFGLLLKPLGLVVAMVALIVVSSLGSHEFRWKESVVLSVVMGALVWAVFIYGLSLTIPVWPAFIGD